MTSDKCEHGRALKTGLATGRLVSRVVADDRGYAICMDCGKRWVPEDLLREAARVIEIYRIRVRGEVTPKDAPPGAKAQAASALEYLVSLSRRIDAVLGGEDGKT